MNAKYELVMKDFIACLFPPKVLQHQTRYLLRGLYKPRNINISEFIFQINKMVDYLKKFPPFGASQHLLDDDILELVKFSLPREWQKELII